MTLRPKQTTVIEKQDKAIAHTPHKNNIEQLKRCRGVFSLANWEQLSKIHHEMFSEAQQAYDALNDSAQPNVEGLTYQQIRNSQQLNSELELIRANTPIYQNWNNHKKSRYFDKLAQKYTTALKEEDQEPQLSKVQDTNMETPFSHQFENSIVQKSSKKIKKSIKTKSNFKSTNKKEKPLFELQEEPIEEQNIKRVLFFNQSTVRYFSKEEPSEIITDERQYLFSTFDKF